MRTASIIAALSLTAIPAVMGQADRETPFDINLVPSDMAEVVPGFPLGPHQYVVGHRGAAHWAPENTCVGMDVAMELGSDLMEVDVWLTKDDVLICLHDSTIDAHSNGEGKINDLTLEEARQFDYGSWFNERNPDRAQDRFVGAPLPTFEEFLDCAWSVNPNIRLLLEIKEHNPRVIDHTVHELRRRGIIDRLETDPLNDIVVLQSFDVADLEYSKLIAPEIATGYLANPFPAPYTLGTSMPDFVDMAVPSMNVILQNPTFVEAIHQLGLPIMCYTVNDPNAAWYLLTLGVDGIITDLPDMVRAMIDDRGTATTQESRGTPRPEIERVCPQVEQTPTAPFTCQALAGGECEEDLPRPFAPVSAASTGGGDDGSTAAGTNSLVSSSAAVVAVGAVGVVGVLGAIAALVVYHRRHRAAKQAGENVARIQQASSQV